MSGVPRTRGNPNIASLQRIRSLEQEVQGLILHILRLERSLAIAMEECNALRETNAVLSAHDALIQSRTTQVQPFNAVYSRFPVLSHHVTSLMQSTNQRTPCYNSKMKPCCMFAVSMGETLYQLFDWLFGFLSWRQVE
jgi:hypothetical protein